MKIKSDYKKNIRYYYIDKIGARNTISILGLLSLFIALPAGIIINKLTRNRK